MREDNRRPQTEKSAEELLDAALSKYRDVREDMPREGLEDRVIANLRQQSGAAPPIWWNRASAMMAVTAALTLFAVDHLIYHPAASVSSGVVVSGESGPGGELGSSLTALRVNAVEKEVMTEVMTDVVKQAKAFVDSKRTSSLSRRRDLALNLNSRRGDETAGAGLRIDEVRISDVKLDDIVIGANERQK